MTDHLNTLHFAADPDNLLCGKAPIRTLCGVFHQNTTNLNVEQVTCNTCLAAMEDRAVGTEQITKIISVLKAVKRAKEQPTKNKVAFDSWYVHSWTNGYDVSIWANEMRVKTAAIPDPGKEKKY